MFHYGPQACAVLLLVQWGSFLDPCTKLRLASGLMSDLLPSFVEGVWTHESQPLARNQ
jgi:hypothetical protein